MATIYLVLQKNNFIEIFLENKDILSDTGLPKGLVVKDGKICGTILESGVFNVIIRYTDNSSITYNITVPFYQRVN